MNPEYSEALKRVSIIQWKIFELEDFDRCLELTNEIVRFLIEARDHNTDVKEDVVLWHKLAGSTPRTTSRLDYDSPWSILEYVNMLAKREGLDIEK